MHTSRIMGCQSVAIAAPRGDETKQKRLDQEGPNIKVHLRGGAEENAAIDIVIDRFPFFIGRHFDCDHQLSHECVSRRHCCFFLDGEEVWLQDLQSTNGTYLNGKRMVAPEVVREGDRITLDSYSFRVFIAEVPS